MQPADTAPKLRTPKKSCSEAIWPFIEALSNDAFYQTQALRLVGLYVPVGGRAFQHLVHCDLGSSDQVLKALVLDGDGRPDLVEARFERGDAGAQRTVELDGLGQQTLVDHQSRSAGQVSVLAREEGHEGR